jgi:hypothetical protein
VQRIKRLGLGIAPVPTGGVQIATAPTVGLGGMLMVQRPQETGARSETAEFQRD